jgi:hypothetical protein
MNPLYREQVFLHAARILETDPGSWKKLFYSCRDYNGTIIDVQGDAPVQVRRVPGKTGLA